MQHNELHPIDDFARARIACKARKLVGRWGLVECDLEDLEQYFRACLADAALRFDPAVAHWKVFVTTVIERSAEKFKRSHLRRKRHAVGRVDSLHSEVLDWDGETAELGDTLSGDAHFNRTGYRARVHTDDIDLAQDVATIMARLTPAQQQLCRDLMQFSVVELARRRDVPRLRLFRQIRKLEAAFASVAGRKKNQKTANIGP